MSKCKRYLFPPLVAIFMLATACTHGHVSHHDYVAHAGGAIDSCVYTNSLEAVENAINNGIDYIELDLAFTSDSVLVSVHDWEYFREMAGIEPVNFEPVSYEEFKDAKLYGKYTPLDYKDIVNLLEKYPHMHLVIDKISDYETIYENFGKFSHRVIVECFSREDYHDLSEKGFNCYISSLPASRLVHGIKEVLNPIKPVITKYVTSVPLYEKEFNGEMFLGVNYFFDPADVELALYECDNKETADSLFEKHPNVRFIYIDYLDNN